MFARQFPGWRGQLLTPARGSRAARDLEGCAAPVTAPAQLLSGSRGGSKAARYNSDPWAGWLFAQLRKIIKGFRATIRNPF